MSTGIAFDGILFFPVTPFDADDRVDDELLRRHVGTTMEHGPGGVFPACGTGEFHALSTDEAAQVVRSTVETVAGRVPVVAGAGGPLGHAIGVARAAADAGADALLVGHGASTCNAIHHLWRRCAPGRIGEHVPGWNCGLTTFRCGTQVEMLRHLDTEHLPDDAVTSNAKSRAQVLAES